MYHDFQMKYRGGVVSNKLYTALAVQDMRKTHIEVLSNTCPGLLLTSIDYYVIFEIVQSICQRLIGTVEYTKLLTQNVISFMTTM